MNTEDFLWRPQRNAWIKEPGLIIYVRKSGRMIHGKMVCCFDLANIKAESPGEGSFTRYLDRLPLLLSPYGFSGIFAENVHNSRLEEFLTRRGFTTVSEGTPACLYKELTPAR